MSNVLVGGEALTSPLSFITIASNVDIRALSAGGDAASQARLNKLIEVVSLRGQPVILGTPSGSSNPFTLVLATEHADQWTPSTLEDAIIAHQKNGQGFTSSLTITIASSL